MKNGEIILQNHLLGFAILLFIIGIINIWIAWKLCKEVIANKKHLEEANHRIEKIVIDQIELIRKESW